MAYTQQTWVDNAAGNTPLSSARLNYMEAGIGAAANFDGGLAATRTDLGQFRRGTAAQWASANPTLSVGEVGLETDTGVLRVGDGSTAFLSLSAGIRTCKQTAQVTNNASASPTDVTGQAFAVQSGHLYIVKFFQPFQSDTSTTGVGWRCSGPSMSFGAWNGLTEQGASGTDKFWETGANTFGGLLSASASVASINTTVMAILEGIFTPSADGTIQLRIQRETDVAGEIVTAMAGGRGFLIDCGV